MDFLKHISEMYGSVRLYLEEPPHEDDMWRFNDPKYNDNGELVYGWEETDESFQMRIKEFLKTTNEEI